MFISVQRRRVIRPVIITLQRYVRCVRALLLLLRRLFRMQSASTLSPTAERWRGALRMCVCVFVCQKSQFLIWMISFLATIIQIQCRRSDCVRLGVRCASHSLKCIVRNIRYASDTLYPSTIYWAITCLFTAITTSSVRARGGRREPRCRSISKISFLFCVFGLISSEH